MKTTTQKYSGLLEKLNYLANVFVARLVEALLTCMLCLFCGRRETFRNMEHSVYYGTTLRMCIGAEEYSPIQTQACAVDITVD